MKLCLYIINVCISIDYIKIERNVFCEGSWISIHEFECPDIGNKFDLKKKYSENGMAHVLVKNYFISVSSFVAPRNDKLR
jgi:hypothetical protein